MGLAEFGRIPAPLVDSPKCAGCSLVAICLPDETMAADRRTMRRAAQLVLFGDAVPAKKPVTREVRRLVTPRDELRPLYLNTQGMRVGKSGRCCRCRRRRRGAGGADGEICQVNLMGNVQISTQAVQALCEAEVPVCYFSMGGWFYGITTGMNTKNVFLRRASSGWRRRSGLREALARRLVAGKIRNQRTMLQRNHVEPRGVTLDEMKEMAERAERAGSLRSCWGSRGMRRGCISGISRE